MEKTINNNILEDYCSFEVSKLLLQKSFKIFTPTCYFTPTESTETSFGTNNSLSESFIARPTHALAIKWIRENFDIDIWITYDYPFDTDSGSYKASYFDKNTGKHGVLMYTDEDNPDVFIGLKSFKIYEEATEAALLYTLTNLI